MIVVLNALTVAYVVWRAGWTLPDFAWTPAALWPWLFFSCEMVVTVYEVWSLCILARVTDHSPRADVYERRLRGEEDLPTVDVFIPTYNEGAEILEQTILAALALDYPVGRVRVWILDDGRRPWLGDLCRRHGVGYLARPTNEHGKAGNLNYALPRTQGEFVLVIDADFQLGPNFLYRTLGFLLYQKGVAVVQTPQHFRNPDPVQHNLLGSGAWTEEQNFFMTVVQSARDAHDNAFCVGSGWLTARRGWTSWAASRRGRFARTWRSLMRCAAGAGGRSTSTRPWPTDWRPRACRSTSSSASAGAPAPSSTSS